jgi:hypothetical protein
MKRSLATIGYIAGLIERHMQFGGNKIGDHLPLRLRFTNRAYAEHVARYVDTVVHMENKHGPTWYAYFTMNQTAEWYMTTLPLLSQKARKCVLQFLAVWQSTPRRNYIRQPITKCKHLDRIHYARGMCRYCYGTHMKRLHRIGWNTDEYTVRPTSGRKPPRFAE